MLHPLAETELLVALSSSSLMASRPRLSLKDLSSMPIACYADGVLLDFLELHFDRRMLSYVGNDSQVIFEMVSSNNAMTFMPSIARFKRLPESIRLCHIDATLVTEIGVMESPNRRPSSEKDEALETIPSWKRMRYCILRNDNACRFMSFGLTREEQIQVKALEETTEK